MQGVHQGGLMSLRPIPMLQEPLCRGEIDVVRCGPSDRVVRNSEQGVA